MNELREAKKALLKMRLLELAIAAQNYGYIRAGHVMHPEWNTSNLVDQWEEETYRLIEEIIEKQFPED